MVSLFFSEIRKSMLLRRKNVLDRKIAGFDICNYCMNRSIAIHIFISAVFKFWIFFIVWNVNSWIKNTVCHWKNNLPASISYKTLWKIQIIIYFQIQSIKKFSKRFRDSFSFFLSHIFCLHSENIWFILRALTNISCYMLIFHVHLIFNLIKVSYIECRWSVSKVPGV